MKEKTILAIGAHIGDAELTAGALLAQCAVHGGKAVTLARRNGVPVSYLDVADGELHPYTEQSAADPRLQFLVKTYNEASFRKQTVPIALYVNLKVTKNIGKWLRLSLFANRLLDYLPDYTSNGLLVRRNVEPYFGMELNFSL